MNPSTSANSNYQKAVEAYSRFYDDHPNLNVEEHLPAIRTIAKRFGLNSIELIQECHDYLKKKRAELGVKIAELETRLGGAVPIEVAANRRAVSVSAKSNHQMAVEALLEQGIVTQGAFSNSPETRDFFLDPEKLRYPLDQLDRIFRTAIEEGKANGAASRKDQYGEEVAILECVSTLVEHAGGWANRTPELKEFYSNLEGWLKDHKLRVRFAPSKAAVQ